MGEFRRQEGKNFRESGGTLKERRTKKKKASGSKVTEAREPSAGLERQSNLMLPETAACET